MDCPKCRNSSRIKDGIIRGKQRYRCKTCRFRYTVERKSDIKTLNTRRNALLLYLEGLGFRRIGRTLKISYGTVYSWVKQWSVSISLPRADKEKTCKTVEPDELIAYAVSQKATGRYGLLLIDLEHEISMLSMNSTIEQTY